MKTRKSSNEDYEDSESMPPNSFYMCLNHFHVLPISFDSPVTSDSDPEVSFILLTCFSHCIERIQEDRWFQRLDGTIPKSSGLDGPLYQRHLGVPVPSNL